MVLRRVLGAFNGIVIGSVIGLAVYVSLAGGTLSVGEFIRAAWDVGTFAFAAVTSGWVLSWVKVYPLAPVWAGLLSGAVGGVLAYALPSVLSVPFLVLPGPEMVVGGFIAALVLGVSLRFLPGL